MMAFDDVAYLISKTYTTNDIGIEVATDTERQVFCTIDSVSQTEWANAGRIGIKPEFRITMFAGDYAGEKEVKYDGTKYEVYRTYRNKFNLELYVEKKAGV